MSADSSPGSVTRLVVCVVVVFGLTALCSLWLWPVMREHAWHANIESIREGMTLSEVVQILGPPQDESPASWAPSTEERPDIDRFYCWRKYDYRFIVGIKDDRVRYIITRYEGMSV